MFKNFLMSSLSLADECHELQYPPTSGKEESCTCMF